jgi:membrane-associated phospholipid phosphatase
VAATASGPFALAVLFRRTRTRDAAIFALQMWAFAVIHELPYDRPERLRERLRVRYPIAIDRLLGAGELPNVRLQRGLSRPGQVTRLDRVLAIVHWAWFLEPHAALVWILLRDDRRFPRAARQMAAAFDIGCAIYFAVPTAPPWWAAENGYIAEQEGRSAEEIVAQAAEPRRLRRVMVEVGEGTWGRAWPTLYSSLGSNPWAAMPSLHFATSLLGAILLSESGTVPGIAGWSYAITLALALVYLGEHYVIDLVVGAGVVATVRYGEPLARPVAERISRLTQRLEAIANS